MIETHTRRKMIHYSLLDSQKYAHGVIYLIKYIVMSACCEMFPENCCAELTTKSIARALVNQSIFKQNSSTQWL